MKNHRLKDHFGITQWFPVGDIHTLDLTLELMRDLGLTHLRTGISWTDFHTTEGRQWANEVMTRLHEQQLRILLCLWHTPPSISDTKKPNGSPKEEYIGWYAHFVRALLEMYAGVIEAVELWNEPNNALKWSDQSEMGWKRLFRMLDYASMEVHVHDLPCILGGLSPVDHGLWLIARQDHLWDALDGLGIHAFFGIREWKKLNDLRGLKDWPELLDYIGRYTSGKPLWVTETGYPARFMLSQFAQAQRLRKALQMCTHVHRLYWYCAVDLPKQYLATEQTMAGYYEPYEYAMGLLFEDGREKRAYKLLKKYLGQQ